MASLSSERQSLYRNPLTETISAVPAVATDLCTTDARVWQVSVCNTTAAAITFTFGDKQSTPRYAMKAVSIAANTSYVIAWPEGQFFSGGISWSASATGLEASIVGSYK